MNKALVSIIIPTFNRADILGETLDSVLCQTYENWECIVVDDGSDDNSLGIAKNYSKSDSRFKSFKRPSHYLKGASSCRNVGLEKAQGELIQFLDSDDLLAKNKIEEQLKRYDSGKLEVFTCKWGGFTDPADLTSRFKYEYQSYRNFNNGIKLLNTFGLFNEFFPLHVYLTPMELIKKAGFWNEKLTNNDDAEFFARVILNAARIKFVPEAVVYYRYNSENKLSEINTFEKVISYLKSLDLISQEINKRYKNDGGHYIKRATTNLMTVLESEDKKLLRIFEGKEFSKYKNDDFDSLFYLLKRKAIQYFNLYI